MPPLKISVDTRTISGAFTGIGRYGTELLHALAALDHHIDYTLLATDDGAPILVSLERTGWRVIAGHAPIPSHPRSDLWLHATLPRWIRRHGIDVHFSLANYLPIASGGARRVVTIHDLVPFRHPEGEPMKFTLFLKTMLRLSARVADRIVAVSEFTSRELQELLHVPAERIRVIPNGPSSTFRELDAAERERLLAGNERLRALPQPFLLTAGHHLARKNFPRLIEAHAALAERGHPHHLVIVGPEGPGTPPLERAIRDSRHGNRVHRFGHLPDGDLNLLYNLAAIFVYPSLYEGFGLPVLEAFDAAVPLVASRTSSIPEVAADAALLVDPRSLEDLTAALEAVLTRTDLRQDLIARGKARRSAFSWRTAAERTAAALLELRGPPAPW